MKFETEKTISFLDLVVGAWQFIHGFATGAILTGYYNYMGGGVPVSLGAFIGGLAMVALWYFQWWFLGRWLGFNPAPGRRADVLALFVLWFPVVHLYAVFPEHISNYTVILITVITFFLLKFTSFAWHLGRHRRTWRWSARITAAVICASTTVIISFGEPTGWTCAAVFILSVIMSIILLSLIRIPGRAGILGWVPAFPVCITIVLVGYWFSPCGTEEATFYKETKGNWEKSAIVKGMEQLSGLMVTLKGETRHALALPINHGIQRKVTVSPECVFRAGVGITKGPGGYQVSAFVKDERGQLHRIGVWYFKRDKTRWEDIFVKVERLVGSKALLILQASTWFPGDKESREDFSYLYISQPRFTRVSSPKARNLVIILIDALRADHLQLYGYERKTAPFIERFAKNSIVFRKAYSTAPWTTFSVASLFTGKKPSDHGVAGFSFGMQGEKISLAECLNNAGYHTAAITANPAISFSNGYGRGFDEFHEIPLSYLPAKSTQWITQEAIKWLSTASQKQPYFLYLHYYDPHWPYTAFLTPFGPKMPFKPLISVWSQITQLNNNVKLSRDSPALRSTIDNYDGEIMRVDRSLGKMSNLMFSQNQSLRQTVFVVTADHGEEFMEHGCLAHGHNLYNETLHVPLIIRLPKEVARNSQVNAPVSLMNLAMSLLDVTNSGAECRIPGESWFAGRPDGPPHPFEKPIISEHMKLSQDISIRSVMLGNRKLIITKTRKGSPDIELYFLDEDPGEHRNIAQAHPEIVKELGRYIQAWELPPQKILNGLEISPSMKKKLKALGYLR